MAGVIFFAPGQNKTLLDGLRNEGITAQVIDIPTDFEFGTLVGTKVMGEIKVAPDDLIASIRDRGGPSRTNRNGVTSGGSQGGRMVRQNLDLGANEGPSILLYIGKLEFNNSSEMMIMKDGRPTGVTYWELIGRELTLGMIGVLVLTCPDMRLAGKMLATIYHEFQKPEHKSHLTRPGFAGDRTISTWEKPSRGDRIVYIFQGYAGVGYSLGRALWKQFGTLKMFAVAQENHLMTTDKVGKKRAEMIFQANNARYEDYFDE